MKQIEEWSRRAAEGYASSFNPAVIYVGLGDRAQALDLLEMAYNVMRIMILMSIMIAPMLSGCLRSRFAASSRVRMLAHQVFNVNRHLPPFLIFRF